MVGNSKIKICIPGCGRGHDALYLADKGFETFRMFEFSKLGLIFIFVGTIYILIVGKWFLPSRSVTTSIPDFIGRNTKRPNHPAISNEEIIRSNPAIYLVPNLDLVSKSCICAMKRF